MARRAKKVGFLCCLLCYKQQFVEVFCVLRGKKRGYRIKVTCGFSVSPGLIKVRKDWFQEDYSMHLNIQVCTLYIHNGSQRSANAICHLHNEKFVWLFQTSKYSFTIFWFLFWFALKLWRHRAEKGRQNSNNLWI